jgi:ABC-type branched-subunit amino acid transport system ATPase component
MMTESQPSPAVAGAALSVENLTAGYGAQVIIREVSLTVSPGQVVSVIGANGSGKSTIAKAVMGLCRVVSGSVRLDGTELVGKRTPVIARTGLGYVPQLDNVFGDLTVRENLEMGAYSFPRRRTRERIESVVRVFPELEHAFGKKAKQLSGGQRGMLGVSRALMGSPRVIILDEPTAGLAPIYRSAVWEHTVRVAAAGIGVLVVEQDARAAIRNSQRCCVVANGRVADQFDSSTVADATEVAGFYLGV